MKRIQLLAVAVIVIALGAGATVKSFTSANPFAEPRQGFPVPQPANTAHSPTMPILVPAEAVDPTAAYFAGTGDGSNGFWIRR
jgi:hypothetical protein